ncbi:MAG TPA: NAD(P)H-hydrate dehydratase [Longimicrobiales bacterium]|nr:NAD(P)H-hydrate dehydratase [Longimicrobiales bacterium]
MRHADVYGWPAVPLPTAAESAEQDRAARAEAGIPERVLMEDAGRSAALLIQRLYPEGRVVAAVGGGHNGGDAVVVLRSLRAWGRDVAFVRAGSRLPDPFPSHGYELPELKPEEAAGSFAAAGVIVDGILGTGTAGAPREPAASLIRAINASGRPVVALDLPSGVDATTGAVPGEAVQAEVTVTFGSPKLGLMLHPARGACGRLVAVEIGFPPAAARAFGAELITPGWAAARRPARDPSGHKGTSGRVLVLAGSEGMVGAAAITAEAAVRAGAGLVHVASAAANRAIVESVVPETIFVDREAGLPPGLDALVAGPGMGKDAAARRALEAALEATPGKPALLDADALTLMAADPEALRAHAAGRPIVLTPHPGEAARFTGGSVAQIVARRPDVARELAERTGCVVLLKGQPSVIAAPGAPLLVNTTGSSDVASAGMGDQLSGTIGALLAAGLAARDAAGVGLFFAGRAADLAARGRSLSPRDVSAHLHLAFARPGARTPPFRLPFVSFDQPPRW